MIAKGFHHTPEAIAKMRKAKEDFKPPPQNVAKLRQRMLGNRLCVGRKLSEQQKRKIGEGVRNAIRRKGVEKAQVA